VRLSCSLELVEVGASGGPIVRQPGRRHGLLSRRLM
jgi:hypothetical protein